MSQPKDNYGIGQINEGEFILSQGIILNSSFSLKRKKEKDQED